MISETLAEGLERYKIGAKVRALRQKKKLGLVQLGRHTGLSSAMLSKIERGQIIPTLPTLMRIALVFGVGLEHFFADNSSQRPIAVVRKKDRLRLPNDQDDDPPSYFFESLDFPITDRKFEAFYAEFLASSAPSKPHQHEGAELIYILKGSLAVTVEEEEHVLEEGDAVYFDSDAPHSYRREGRSSCSAIVVVAPRTPWAG